MFKDASAPQHARNANDRLLAVQVDAIEKTAWLDKLTLASSPDKVLREAQPTSAAKTAAVASLPMSAATGVTA